MGKDIDSKIVFALERIFNAFRALLWERVKETNLSPIQLQFLLYLKKYPEKMRNVSNISAEFKLTKATVSDSLNVLERKNLILKEKSKKDKRFSIVKLTKEGEKIAESLNIMNEPIKKILRNFPEKEKERIFLFFVRLIESMRKDGIIKIARVCISCSHFKEIVSKRGGKFYYCELTKKKFPEREIKIDCIYHEPASL